MKPRLSNFRDLRLATKQTIGFGLVLVVMTGASLFAINQMEALRYEIDRLNENALPRAIAVADLNLDASALRLRQLQYALTTNADDEQALVDEMIDLIEAINADRDLYERLEADADWQDFHLPSEDSLYQAFDEMWETYQDQFLALLTFYESGRKTAAVALLTGEAGAVFTAFSGTLKELVRLNKRMASERAAQAGARYRRARNITWVLLGGTILCSILFAGTLVQYTVGRVRQLERAAWRVAEGDLEVHLYDVSHDEIGSLALSFNKMTRALRLAQEERQQQADRLQAQQAALQTANLDLARQKQEIEQKNDDLQDALTLLQDTQRQLVLKEKMASLGALTAGIAHEIKNPLNFVNNFALLSAELAEELAGAVQAQQSCLPPEALKEIETLVTDLKTSAEKIREHGDRADGIVRAMLMHSRGRPGERQPTDLNQLLEEYLNLAFHGLRAQEERFTAHLDRDLDPAVGAVSVVPQEIGRVFLNLLNNAFYAVYEQSQRLNGQYTPRVAVRTRDLGDAVEIEVADNGGGISEAVREKIFEPFFTTKPTGQGTGLGLSLSYDIIAQGHGGTLTVESAEGEGATFCIRLPRV